MLKLSYKKINLRFKIPAGTSRGTLIDKPSWFFILNDSDQPNNFAIGECGILPNLSYDDINGYEEKLKSICDTVNLKQTIDLDFDLTEWPSIRFGYEILSKDYNNKSSKIYFGSTFTNGQYKIPINGLIWMGEKQFMFDQIKTKIDEGWSCIKMKIGAINFEEEIELLKYIRKQFGAEELELRVDANGAFAPYKALEKLKILSDLNLHSIEQPIKANQIDEMADLCFKTPLPIALDEELIGINTFLQKDKLIQIISPQYIILKPSLLGGWEASDEWIKIAKKYNVKYWATSALESNIGLNAIAQWTATLKKDLIHGLGTGKLYHNNFESPLNVKSGYLSFDQSVKWNLDTLL